MNELIVNADGTTTIVGDAGSVSGILDDIVKGNTTPAVYNEDGTVKTAEVVPSVDTLAVEIVADDLKTHAWRLPKAREERLEVIRSSRNAKLFELDDEANQALTGRPGVRAVGDVEANRQVLRDLPPVAEDALSDLTNTDDIAAYAPSELE
tara:strand:+ start:258 stop:710 length:453 start_codon:yes stop_codon:yes gene_type:complete